MRFRDKELTPAAFRFAFLTFTDELAPEVLKTLKALLPIYKKVFSTFTYQQRLHIFDRIIAHKAENNNYILFNLDENFQHYNPNEPVPNENENETLKNFLEFRQSFYEFIDRFGLETEWLKKDLFGFLYDLLDKPQYNTRLDLATSYSWMVYNGEPLSFEFEGWRIEKDSKDFEKSAIAAFKEYLSEYIQITANQAKTDGYKLIRRKHKINNIKWLVLWTVKKISKEKIIEMIDAERSKKSGKETYTDISTLNKAFLKFKKFGLPVRKE